MFMKKYILTETQLQSIIDNELNEQTIKEQRGQILKLKDLAEISSRVLAGGHLETLRQIFVQVFKDEGDQGVINLFRSATKLELEDMGHGRYMIK